MNEERLMQVLLSPHISEKTTAAADALNQHTFRVTTDATKSEIKQAVEKMFNVKVAKVQVVNVKGKSKRFGQRLGRRSDWRKAYVALEAGQDIEFAGAN
ncbi:MAG: 50S ribosomal protein L23 [Gammaproteobacteria bacterium]|nr:50S ribosomal protein L23 [Gammaproteobacteria bacterium]